MQSLGAFLILCVGGGLFAACPGTTFALYISIFVFSTLGNVVNALKWLGGRALLMVGRGAVGDRDVELAGRKASSGGVSRDTTVTCVGGDSYRV